MQTYTHYVMTVVINQQLKRQEAQAAIANDQNKSILASLPPVRSKWMILGSVLPDLPLIAIAIGCIIMDRLAGNQFTPGNEAAMQQTYTGYLFEYMFFHEPWVKAAHNLFHAPLLVLFYIAVGYWAWQKKRQWGSALFWLGAACALHTAIDIPLHYDDGPLLLFPFNWDLRFYSPVSYWDPKRYGVPFAIFEHLLLLGLILYWALHWWWGRQATRRTSGAEV